MTPIPTPNLKKIAQTVALSLQEDIGTGDITAELIASNQEGHANIITRETAIICGIPWVNEVFRQVDPALKLAWKIQEGEMVTRNECLLSVSGKARSLVTAERTALNWLQTLSGTATAVRKLVDRFSHTSIRLLDTRKTIPGLREAQKYAVKIGGGHNHRIGLFDAFLIKENHIASCGGITPAVQKAKVLYPNQCIEVEVENLVELEEAIVAGAHQVMLDNFNLSAIKKAIKQNAGRVTLEVSGGIHADNINELIQAGIDCISIGAFTKHLRAIDLSMRITLSSA